jgi:hypothetical protein
MTDQRASQSTEASVLQPGTPERSSLFDAARRARASTCQGAPRPDTTRRPRRAGRGNGAARQRGGSAATRRPAHSCGRDEHGEHPPVARPEHRGTCPASSWHRRYPHGAASSCARPATDDHGARAVLVFDMVWRRSERAVCSVPIRVGKIRSVAPLCLAYVALLTAGHHGCALACQAPILKACLLHNLSCGIAWTVLTTVFPITLVSACCRSRQACARLLPAALARHATVDAAACARPFAW